MNLAIKNMVCPRCIASVEQILTEMSVKPVMVRLGEVVLTNPLNPTQLHHFKSELEKRGFELLDDNRKQQIERIKAIVIDHIQNKVDEKFSFSKVLSKELHRDYSVLSKLFSETEGITIEQYVILQKIEKAKELIVYNEMTLGEIAFRLGYSSVAHLSAQFKKVTGLTPSQFKAQGLHLRKPIDGISKQ